MYAKAAIIQHSTCSRSCGLCCCAGLLLLFVVGKQPALVRGSPVSQWKALNWTLESLVASVPAEQLLEVQRSYQPYFMWVYASLAAFLVTFVARCDLVNVSSGTSMRSANCWKITLSRSMQWRGCSST